MQRCILIAIAGAGMDHLAVHQIEYRNNVQGVHVRIFVFEYVTGGGFLGRSIPESLAEEGDLMLQALVGDLAGLGHEIVTMRDGRLAEASLSAAVWPVHHSRELVPTLRRAMAACDAAWPIAPESAGELQRLCEAVLSSDRILLGSRPEAVELTANKFMTLTRLAQFGMPVVPTVRGTAVLDGAALPDMPWVVKPNDGAGCEDTYLVRDEAELRNRVTAAPNPDGVIVQAYVEGVHASLSLLLAEERATLLACNRQQIELRQDAFHLAGCIVNGLDFDADALAQEIARAIPGLWGYVGVDFVLAEAGPQLLEINPRLTTSYAGLSRSLGVNAAGLVLDLLLPAGARAQVPVSGKPVTVALAQTYGG